MNEKGDCAECIADRLIKSAGPYTRGEAMIVADMRSAGHLIKALLEDNERHRDKLHKIHEWAKAYPITIFPEPDLKRVHLVLKAAGMSLDVVSASAMRHVLQTLIKDTEEQNEREARG